MGSQDQVFPSPHDEEYQARSDALDLVGLCCLPMALKAAIELDVFGILSKAGPDSKHSAAQIAAQMPTTNPNAAATLERILRLLACNSVLSSSLSVDAESGKAETLYSLTRMCKYLLPDSDGVSLAPLMVMNYDKVHMNSYYYLKDAVLEGCIPFNKAFGSGAFEYMATDARFSNLFNQGMFNHSTFTTREFLENYKGFEEFQGKVVDVGGGVGAAVKMIVSKYPRIEGINFDLPYVIAQAPVYPGMKHVGGDMFESVPSGDIMFMKWILHDWDDGHCTKLLKNCWKALPESGKVIVVEWILPEEIKTDTITRRVISVDLMMLAYNPGGKERTIKEYQALAKGAGFPTTKVISISHGMSAVEFYKKPQV